MLGDELLAGLGQGQGPANMQKTLTASSRRRAGSSTSGRPIISAKPTVSGVAVWVAAFASAVSPVVRSWTAMYSFTRRSKQAVGPVWAVTPKPSTPTASLPSPERDGLPGSAGRRMAGGGEPVAD